MSSPARRPSVAVIGAGMAGLVAARRLCESCDVVVLDKGRGVGGRLATRRIGDATLDHGAQFITTHTEVFARMVRAWADASVVTSWFQGRVGPAGGGASDGHTRFRGVVSMNALAKHLAVGLDVRTTSLVTALRGNESNWSVVLADGSELLVDAVVVTAPVPQTLALLEQGGVLVNPRDADALLAVEYNPCLALMAVLDGPSGLPDPGAIDPAGGPIDWMADNARKGISSIPAVTIHATAEFSRQNWDATDDEIANALLAAADLASSAAPDTLQIQRWRYARPSAEHPDRCLQLTGFAPLVCAGDAFGGAKVEGAALSGLAAADAIAAALGVGG